MFPYKNHNFWHLTKIRIQYVQVVSRVTCVLPVLPLVTETLCTVEKSFTKLKQVHRHKKFSAVEILSLSNKTVSAKNDN